MAPLSPVSWVVVGVDPGGSATGLVIRHGDRLVWSDTIHRDRDELVVVYAARVFHAVDEAVGRAAHSLGGGSARLLAVEDVVGPSPHVRLTNVKGLLGTAIVLGSVVTCDRVPQVLVRPRHHGSAPLLAYPEALRPKGGQGRGRDALRHVRSAWDVAGAGAAQARQEMAFANGTRP